MRGGIGILRSERNESIQKFTLGESLRKEPVGQSLLWERGG